MSDGGFLYHKQWNAAELEKMRTWTRKSKHQLKMGNEGTIP